MTGFLIARALDARPACSPLSSRAAASTRPGGYNVGASRARDRRRCRHQTAARHHAVAPVSDRVRGARQLGADDARSRLPSERLAGDRESPDSLPYDCRRTLGRVGVLRLIPGQVERDIEGAHRDADAMAMSLVEGVVESEALLAVCVPQTIASVRSSWRDGHPHLMGHDWPTTATDPARLTSSLRHRCTSHLRRRQSFQCSGSRVALPTVSLTPARRTVHALQDSWSKRSEFIAPGIGQAAVPERGAESLEDRARSPTCATSPSRRHRHEADRDRGHRV